ncbi:MAG: hypothetical protein QNJ42_20945 [Crocosphaera sp.]|nr:hypothetical protein [Crocosphaera sp.]
MNNSAKTLKTILDHDVYTIVTLYKDLENDFIASASSSFTVSVVQGVPEPSNVISLLVVSGLGLGLGGWDQRKKHQVKKNKNNLQKSEPSSLNKQFRLCN